MISETTTFSVNSYLKCVVTNGVLQLDYGAGYFELSRPEARLLAGALLRASDITKAKRKPKPPGNSKSRASKLSLCPYSTQHVSGDCCPVCGETP